MVEKPGGWSGVGISHEPIPINVGVGDLDHDGKLWIVGATSTGKVYVWGADGQRRERLAGPARGRRRPARVAPHSARVLAPAARRDLRGADPLRLGRQRRPRDRRQAGYDGHLHLYEADGGEITTGNWPIQVRVPDSVPITRPALNNPTETRTPIRMQDYRISSNPALAQLDADPELEIVVRSQMSDTLPSDGIEVLSGVGHLNAYDHDGAYLWTAKMDSVAFYYGSAQEFITEGSNSPAVADIDDDGKDEVVSNPVLSLYAYPFKGDGTAFGLAPWTSPPAGIPNPALPIPDVPVGFTTSGAFGMFGGALTYAQAGSDAVSIIGALLTAGSGLPIVNKERAWTALTGTVVPGFPANFQGLNFLGAPIFVDVTGDGLAEIVDGGDSSALHAFGVGGLQATGFPNFTSGWMIWSPTAGDLDSDGTIELVANTREGNTMVWHTAGVAASNVEWWRYRHDEWNTGRYGVDSRPPGILRTLVGDPDAHSLTFTAPGDDWYAGQADHYRIVHSGGTLDLPATVAAGASETLVIPPAIDSGTVQAVDERGNLGKPASFDVSGLPTPTPTATPGAAVCGPAPASGCRLPAVQRKALLQLRNRTPDTKDRLLWKWLKGAATAKSDFGDPTTTTGYRLCVYDGDATLIATAAIPAAGTCNTASPRPCWRASASGYRYVDRDLTPDGIQQLILKAGAGGKAQIVLKGRGDSLPMPTLPISQLPVRVQLVGSNGACFEATYGTTLKNQQDQFKAKAD